ncbi:putative membrane protein [Emiliania huxleyi virus 18]|nr:putative membrane protein [Emiliania huxleyi virus 18]AHA55285.1 putative membrane protein [Emiliania huxleyi virus 156]
MQKIVKKIIVLLISVTISAIVYVLSPKDMFAPVLGLVASTAMVGLCTNTILIKLFGYQNQIDQTPMHIEDFPPEYYAQQALEEELLRQENEESLKEQQPVESGDKKPDEPMDDAAAESEPVATPEKSVNFAENIAEYKEYVPESDTPRRRRRKKHAIQEFADVITANSGEPGILPEESEQRIVEFTQPDVELSEEQPVPSSPTEKSVTEHVESIVPLVEDGAPYVENVPEGTPDSPPASPKKSRRRSRK